MKHISTSRKRTKRWIFLGALPLAFAVFLLPALAQTLPPPPPPPAQAPPVPTGLAGSSPSQTQINLSWTAVTDGWLSGYRVYRCSGAGCTPTAQVGTTNSTTTTFSNTGLSAGTYVYAVSAYSGFGESSKSTSVTVTTQSRTYGIADFTALVAQWLQTGTGLSADVNTDNTVNTRDLGIMMSYWAP